MLLVHLFQARCFKNRIRERMPAPTTNEQVTLQASGSKGKALPQNIEAEKTVLSACLLSTGVFEEVSLKLRPKN